jgi:hypothetical protein
MADLDADIRAHVGRLCQAPDERTPIDRLALVEAYYKATRVIGAVLDWHARVALPYGRDEHCCRCQIAEGVIRERYPCETVLAIVKELGIEVANA